MEQVKLYIIMNKNAGSGNAEIAAKKVLQYLDEKEKPYEAFTTNYQGHAIEIAEKLCEEVLVPWGQQQADTPFPLLTILGGDGTLHEVVNALGTNFDIPIAYLPSGSGNDFARGVSINRDPLDALEHIYQTIEPQFFNIIKYDEKIADEKGLVTNNLGIGLDATIVAFANESKSKQQLNKFNLGSFTYLFSAIKVLFKQKSFPLQVMVNGAEYNFPNAYLCTTTNHPYFGGGIAIAPDADIRENKIELVLLEKVNIFIIIHLVILLFRKKHLNSKFIHHYKTEKLRLISTVSEYAQADGESLGKRPYDITFKTTERLFWL